MEQQMPAQKTVQKEILQMRELGKQVYEKVMGGMVNLRIPTEVVRQGADVVQASDFRFLKAKEIKYSAENPFTGVSIKDATWISVMEGRGVTILPITSEGVVLISKLQPSVKRVSIELVSGGVRGVDAANPAVITELKDIIKLNADHMTTIKAAAARELQEETGLKAEKLTVMLENLAHAPHRLYTVDSVVLAEGITFAGRKGGDKEEVTIAPFIASWSEVKAYMKNNAIIYAMSRTAIETYMNPMYGFASDEVLQLIRK